VKKLTSQAFAEINLWMHRNARPVDLAVWRYHFENGSREAVLAELSLYRNEDGGFGHALEPDSWNPDSSPYTTLYAMNILKSIGSLDGNHPMLCGIFRYLNECTDLTEYGWRFSIPSNDLYPHAPWWTYNEEANACESIGLTAGTAGFVLRYGSKDSPLYRKAVSFAGTVIKKLKAPGKYGDMGIGGYCALLDSIQNAGLKEKFDCNFLAAALKRQVHDTIERDTSKWVHYGVRPSNYIHSPESPYLKDNEDIIQKELDFLIDTRPHNGVWPITWSWFENNEKYYKAFALSENWWRAIKGTEKVLLLKSFGRLENC
jgi:hypothetical protein